jgi:hypothetical protein
MPEPINPTPYNPLDKRNLGKSVAEALLEQAPTSMPSLSRKSGNPPFAGAGVYAIYYIGDFEPYRIISLANRDNKFEQPIYVGKAVPSGSRKGGSTEGAYSGAVLYDRLRQHAASIEQSANLTLSDFRCRFLVVDDIWIPLGESLLIEMFKPIWNHVVDGFGIHDPGQGRVGQRRSMWDVLHPGRRFAGPLPDNARSEAEILELIAKHFSKAST